MSKREVTSGSWSKNLWILWFGVLLSSASYTMVVPFLPLFLLDIGVTKESVKLWTGVIFSSAFLVGAIMAPIWGARADKSGKRKMVIRAGISLGVVYLLTALVQNPWQLLAVRLLQGFASGFVPASMAIVATTIPDNKMGWGLGIMQTAGATGTILGPLLGGVLAELFGMRMSFVISSLVIFTATLTVWLFVYEEKSLSNHQPTHVWEDMKTAWHNKIIFRMLIFLFLIQVVNMALQPLITLYVAELQGKLEGAVLSSGVVFSLTGIAGILAAPYWGKKGQQKGFFIILSISLLVSGMVNMTQYFTTNIWQFSIIQFIFGLFIAGALPSINAIVVENTDADFRGRAFGLTTSANQLGGMIGPLLGGLVGSFVGIGFVFVVTGLTLVICGGYVAGLTRKIREVREAS